MNERYVYPTPRLSRHDRVARAMSPVLAVSVVAICVDGLGTIHQGRTMLELESLIDVSPAVEFAINFDAFGPQANHFLHRK